MKEPKTRVFVVDDDDSVRVALHRLIRSVGIDVESFSSAGEFLSRLPHEGPGCLVSDIRMPGMSGLDLQEKLSDAGHTMPVIFITGHGTVPVRVQAMKAGGVDFLEKPFEDQVLLDLIQHSIESDRAAKRADARKNELLQRFESLTSREKEVFALVAAGNLNKQIAFELEISEKSVKVHRGRVMEIMQAESLADLVRMAEEVPLPKA